MAFVIHAIWAEIWTSLDKLKYCVIIFDNDSRIWYFSGGYLMMLRIFKNKNNVT